jgi:2-deoxy-D-gluconate 3-dehydrogenase
MDLELAGKVAIVTGASRGLGEASALAMVKEGACVVVAARSTEELHRLEQLSPSQIHAAFCDLRDLDSVASLVDIAVDKFGRIDIVVNNAGVDIRGSFVEQSVDEWLEGCQVNLLSAFCLTAAAGRHFMLQNSGKVINISSTAGLRGKAGLVVYSATKAALLQFTASLAEEWGSYGVQVNAIAPGAFATDIQKAVTSSKERYALRVKTIPAGRLAAPSEIGPLICYLASSLSDFVSGSTFVIDGGEVGHL